MSGYQDREDPLRRKTGLTKEIEFSLTEDGFITDLSSEVSLLLGYETHEIEDASFFALLPADEREKCLWIMEQVENLQQPVRMGLRLNKKQGGCLYTEAVIAPDEAGIGLTVQVKVLGESEPLFANLVGPEESLWLEPYRVLSEQTSEAWLMVRDRENSGEIMMANPAACRLMGCNEDELTGTNIMDWCLPECRETGEKALAAKAGETFSLVLSPVAGGAVPVQLRIAVMNDSESGYRLFMLQESQQGEASSQRTQQREEEFRVLAEESPDMIVRYNRNKERIYVNRTFARLFGVSEDELLGRPVQETGLLTDRVEKLEALIDAVFASGEIREEVFKPLATDDTEYFHARLAPERSSDGEVISVLGVFRAITAQKMAERAMQEKEDEYHRFMDSFHGLAFMGDGSFQPLFMAGSVEAITGYEASDFLEGKLLWRDVVHPDDYDALWEQIVQDRQEPGRVHTQQYRVVRKDGQIRWVEQHIRYYYPEKGGELRTHGTVYDITERKEMEEALQISEKRYKMLVETIQDVFYVLDDRQRIVYLSPSIQPLTGYEPEEMIGESVMKFIWPEDLDLVKENMRRKTNGELDTSEHRIMTKTGGYRYVRASSWPLHDESLYGPGLYGIMSDIQAEHQALESLKNSEAQFRSLTENVPGAVYRINMDDESFVFLSDGFERISGYPTANFLGDQRRTYDEIIYEKDREETTRQFSETVRAGKEFSHEYRIVRADGSLRWVLGRAKGYFEDGEIQWVVGMITDIQERKEAEAQVEYLTFHDRMTGLYNRNFFDVELKRLDVERMLPLSLIIGDVNGLKLVNDSLGHQMGDEMLILIARTIADACRQEDIICRWGGDEFAILLPQTWPRDAAEIMDRINERCAAIEDFPVPVSVSLGTAAKTELEQSMDEVIREAEARMYKAKLTDGKDFHIRVVYALQEHLHERSDETPEHSVRLRQYSHRLAEYLGLGAEEMRKLELLADLHDVGKLVVPEDVLIRPGPLTDDERELVEAHCEHGVKIIQSAASLLSVADEILAHHEWYDGNGYPRGLKGEAIPLLARIFSIVDAYDVMTQGRSYRPAMTAEQACSELKKHRGQQFDPGLVDAFIFVLQEDGLR